MTTIELPIYQSTPLKRTWNCNTLGLIGAFRSASVSGKSRSASNIDLRRPAGNSRHSSTACYAIYGLLEGAYIPAGDLNARLASR